MPGTDPLRAVWSAHILIADDESLARRLLRRILERAGYTVTEADSGRSALSAARELRPDLVILDINMPDMDGIEMPDMDGIEVCRLIKTDSYTHLTPVIHVTGNTVRSERLRAIEAGSDEFVGKPFDIDELLIRVRSLLRTKRLTDHLISSEAVVYALAKTVEARDLYTERHLRRVADRAVKVALRLGIEEPEVETVRLGGLLHDLGKIAVPDRILLKPGPLDRTEFTLVRTHPEAGAEIVRPLRSFETPEPVVLHHHERFDGTGYPYGLRGAAIPLAARIVSVADAFDAMTTDRPYRKGCRAEVAFQRLEDGRGEQWDPDVVDAFLAAFGDTQPDEAAPWGSRAEDGGAGDHLSGY
jgi:putative two-component system response regulator